MLGVQDVSGGICVCFQSLEDNVGLGCIVVAGDDVHVGLNTINGEVDAVAVLNSLQVNIDHLVEALRGSPVVAVHSAGNTQVLAQASLVHDQLVSGANSRSVNILDLGYGSGLGGFLSRAALTGNEAVQSTALAVFQIALVVHQVAGNSDGVANLQVCAQLAQQTVADDLVAVDLNITGQVHVVSSVSGGDFGNNTGHGGLIRQRPALFQSLSSSQDLSGGSGAGDFGTLLDCHCYGSSSKLNSALIVSQSALNGNSVARSQVSDAVAGQTVAVDGLVGQIANLNDNGNVVIACIVRNADALNNTGHGNAFQNNSAFDDIAVLILVLTGGLVIAVVGGQGVSFLNDLLIVLANAVRLGNLAVNAVGDGLAVSVGNGSGQNIVDLLGSQLRQVDLHHVVLQTGNNDGFYIGGPLYIVGDAIDQNDAGYLIVGSGLCIRALEIVVQVLLSLFETAFSRLVGLGLATCKQCETQCKYQREGNDFFHLFAPLF